MRSFPSSYDRDSPHVGYVHCWYSDDKDIIALPSDFGTRTPTDLFSLARHHLHLNHPEVGIGATDSSHHLYATKGFLYRGTIVTLGERLDEIPDQYQDLTPRRKLWITAETRETLTDAADKLGLPLGDLTDKL